MNTSGKPSGCPFHREANKITQHGGGGLPYRKLRDRVDREGWDAVLSELSPTARRALLSGYSSEIFWDQFENDHDLDHQQAQQRLEETSNRYEVLLTAAVEKIEAVLVKMFLLGEDDAITGVQGEAYRRLSEIVKQESVKTAEYGNQENHLLSEITGALILTANFCELIERLHREQTGQEIPPELFQKILRSEEFRITFTRLANGSEDLVSDFGKHAKEAPEPGEENKRINLFGPMSLDRFSLNTAPGKDYPLLHMKAGAMNEFIAGFDTTNIPHPPKVRCPASDLKVKSFYSTEKISMVQALLEWYLEEVVIPHLK